MKLGLLSKERFLARARTGNDTFHKIEELSETKTQALRLPELKCVTFRNGQNR